MAEPRPIKKGYFQPKGRNMNKEKGINRVYSWKNENSLTYYTQAFHTASTIIPPAPVHTTSGQSSQAADVYGAFRCAERRLPSVYLVFS